VLSQYKFDKEQRSKQNQRLHEMKYDELELERHKFCLFVKKGYVVGDISVFEGEACEYDKNKK
jgi:hypothetical protein